MNLNWSSWFWELKKKAIVEIVINSVQWICVDLSLRHQAQCEGDNDKVPDLEKCKIHKRSDIWKLKFQHWVIHIVCNYVKFPHIKIYRFKFPKYRSNRWINYI